MGQNEASELSQSVSRLSKEPDERLLGRYDALARLSTSVRFNRPQMEIIEDDAAEVREELQRRGFQFFKPGTREPLRATVDVYLWEPGDRFTEPARRGAV